MSEAVRRPPAIGAERILAGLLLVLSLPLAGVVGPVLPYGTLLLALIVTAYLVGYARYAFIFDGAAGLFFAAFALLGVVYSLSAQNPQDVLFVFNFTYLLLYVPIVSLFQRLKAGERASAIGKLALLGTALMLVMGVIEMLAFGTSRAGYLSTDAIRFGAAAVILGFLSLVGLLGEGRGWTRWLYFAAPTMALAVVFLTGTRGSLVAFVALALLAPLFLARRKLPALAIASGVLLALLAVGWASGIAGWSRMGSVAEVLRETFAGEKISDAAFAIRLDFYQAAVRSFLDSPWIGHGWPNIIEAPQKYIRGDTLISAHSHLHNDLLNLAVAGGIGGILAYIAILAGPPLAAWRSPRDRYYRARLYGCTILSVGYFVLGSSSLMLGFEYPTALYVCLAAVLLGYCRETTPPGHAP